MLPIRGSPLPTSPVRSTRLRPRISPVLLQRDHEPDQSDRGSSPAWGQATHRPDRSRQHRPPDDHGPNHRRGETFVPDVVVLGRRKDPAEPNRPDFSRRFIPSMERNVPRKNCGNPVLTHRRTTKREGPLKATEEDREKIREPPASRLLPPFNPSIGPRGKGSFTGCRGTLPRGWESQSPPSPFPGGVFLERTRLFPRSRS